MPTKVFLFRLFYNYRLFTYNIMYSALSIAPNNPAQSNNIQTDLRVFTAHGVRGNSIVSGVPYKLSDEKVLNQAIGQGVISHQIDIAMQDHQVRTWKVDELVDVNSINEVASSIRKHNISSVIFNPVLKNAGNETYSSELLDALVLELLPLSKLVVLEKKTALKLIDSDESKPARIIATELHELGANYVYILDLPEEGSFEYVDIFFDGNASTEIRSPIISPNIKAGLVTTLATSISAYIARGMPLEQAVQSGREYLTVVIASTDSDPDHVSKFGLNHTLNRMIIDEPAKTSAPLVNASAEIEDLSKYIDMIEDGTTD